MSQITMADANGLFEFADGSRGPALCDDCGPAPAIAKVGGTFVCEALFRELVSHLYSEHCQLLTPQGRG